LGKTEEDYHSGRVLTLIERRLFQHRLEREKKEEGTIPKSGRSVLGEGGRHAYLFDEGKRNSNEREISTEESRAALSSPTEGRRFIHTEPRREIDKVLCRGEREPLPEPKKNL